MPKKGMFPTRTLVMLGLLAALSVVLERLLAIMPTENIRIAFGNLPIILAGLLFGPVAGGITGLVADFIGTALFSPWPWYPPLALTPVIMGVVPGMIGLLLKKRTNFLAFLIMILPAELLGPIIWSNLGLQWLNGVPFFVNLPLRAPVKAAIAAVDILLVFLLYKSGIFSALGIGRTGDKKNELRRNAQIYSQRQVAGE